jgi:hypothetical protein
VGERTLHGATYCNLSRNIYRVLVCADDMVCAGDTGKWNIAVRM